MNRQQLYSQSILSWIQQQVNNNIFHDVVIQGFPQFDIEYFLTGLSQIETSPNVPLRASIAIEGFTTDQVSLNSTVARPEVSSRIRLANSVNEASVWRNHHAEHPHIIAITASQNRIASTLEYFTKPKFADLAERLLGWAENHPVYCSSSSHRLLLSQLTRLEEMKRYLSLENVVSFLHAWINYPKPEDGARENLHFLGNLLPDSELFEHDSNEQKLQQRLRKNLEIVEKIIALKRSDLDRKKNKRGLSSEVFNAVDKIRKLPSSDNRSRLDLASVLREFFNSSSPKPKPDTPNDDKNQDPPNITEAVADLLLDGQSSEIKSLSERYEDLFEEARSENQPEFALSVSDDENEDELVFATVKINDSLLSWVSEFCNQDTWGGFIRSKQPSLRRILEEDHPNAEFLNPSSLRFAGNNTFSIRELLSDFQEALRRKGETVVWVDLWDESVLLRNELVKYVSILVHDPLLKIAGNAELYELISRYLDLRANLYAILSSYDDEMKHISTETHIRLLEGILALDVLQICISKTTGEEAYKAILLPLHPLHLWRYHRLVAVSNGLGSSLSPGERERIRQICCSPYQFLSVIYASHLPAGEGFGDVLPLAGEIDGLATFENFNNALTAADGIETLCQSLLRFHYLYPHHSQPLRVALVNPPDAGNSIYKIARLLKKRGMYAYLKSLRLEIYGTEYFENRLAESRFRVETQAKKRDEIEELIQEKRLELIIHDKSSSINSLANNFKGNPFHIVAIFDIAGISVRQSTSKAFYPMSPFAIRQEIMPDEITGDVRLEPKSDDILFSKFLDLLRSVRGLSKSQLPSLDIQTDSIKSLVDEILQGESPGAVWFFLADRGLPQESGMSSKRLLRKNEGHRQLLLCARNWDRLENRIRTSKTLLNAHVFPSHPGAMASLLEEGIQLTGTGILGLFNEKSEVNNSNIIGYIGMVIAARYYRNQYPNSLIISVDNELARLWLQLREDGENKRCDLIALKEENEELIIECIEVKTSSDSDSPDQDESTLVQRALEQVKRTLSALAEALPDNPADETVPGQPKNEMLKEVFVSGVQTSRVPKELKVIWNAWLKDRLFNDQVVENRVVLRGRIILVQLRRNQQSQTRYLSEQPYLVELNTLTEPILRNVMPGSSGITTLSGKLKTESDNHETKNTETVETIDSKNENSGTDFIENGNTDELINPNETETHEVKSPLDLPEPFPDFKATLQSPLDPNPQSNPEYIWPAKPNALGLIGLENTAQQLLNDVSFSLRFGQRFSDKLFYGPPGVGKTTIADAISRQLLNDIPIRFSGADLRSSQQIIDVLAERNKLNEPDNHRVNVVRCLIFIDEVHASGRQIQTWLLNAIDDFRVTTHQGLEYDFSDVIFIVATTNLGQVLDALRTRFTLVELPPYTLEELAAIICFRGQQFLDGYILPREVCVEIAARCQCSPRRAIRCLENELRQYVAARLPQNAPASLELVGEGIDLDTVSDYFDAKGVDLNGIDERGIRFLQYLERHDSASEATLRQALQIYDITDFLELEGYLRRLGLVEIRQGRQLTLDGRRYLRNKTNLRAKISRI